MKALKIIGIIVLVLIVIAVILFFYARYRLNNVKDRGNLQPSLDKRAASILAKEEAYGLVIGIYKNGQTHIKTYGSLIKGENKPPDINSTFELASSSKLFTTTLLQIMCDKGLLSLDDKIADLLKDHVTLPPSATNATLRHLATHTSGFPSLPQYIIDQMKDDTDPYKDLKTEHLYTYLKTCDDKKPEGSFEYSNFSMGLLGHILALKMGMPYEEAVKQELLQPLGMHHTFVTVDSTNKANIAQGYNEAGNPNPVWTDTVLTGAGSFLSNASDMLLFIRANVDKTNPLYPTLTKTHAQQLYGQTGLGWILPDAENKFMGNKTILWHNGMAGGYASYIAIDTVTGNGLIILTNKSSDPTIHGHLLMRIVNAQSWKE